MKKLYDTIQPALASRTPGLTPAVQLTMIDLLDKWARIANGWDLPFGGKTDNAQVRAGKSIANTLVPAITTPGVRARFNKAASTLNIRSDEPDKLFAAIAHERGRLTAYDEIRRRKEAALDNALAPFQQQAPQALKQWLKVHEPELTTAGQTTIGTWQVFAHLAYQPDPEPTKWLTAAIEHGLAGSASALIDVFARTDQLTPAIVDRLLADPNGRPGVISAVIGQSTNSSLIEGVMAQLAPSDVQQLESAFALKHAPASTRRALFTHPWVIAGKDIDWITATVSEPSFSICVRDLLGALQFQFGHRYPLDTLATMLRPLSPEPEDLLDTLEVGSFSGEDHERYAAKLDTLRHLALSDEEDIARLGRRGIEIYEPLLKEALVGERRAAVRGIRDY